MAPSPKTNTSTIRGGRKTTANKPLLSISKTIEEHLTGIDIRSDVKDSLTATKLLHTHGLIFQTTGSNIIRSTAHALLEFGAAANLGATHTDILRAIAITLIDTEQNLNADNLVDKIHDLLTGPLELLQERTESLAEATASHQVALECAIVELRGNLHSTSEMIEGAITSATKATEQAIAEKTSIKQPEGQRSYISKFTHYLPQLSAT